MTQQSSRHRHSAASAQRYRGAGLALALLLSVSGLMMPAPTAQAARATPRCASRSGVTVGECAPLFTLLDAHGHVIRLAQYRGHPVLLNFWGIDCSNCADELPDLQLFARAFAQRGGIILGINTWGDSQAEIAAYARLFAVHWPLLPNGSSTVGDLYMVQGTPTNVFVDRTGMVRAYTAGPLTVDDFQRYARRL